jgi:serine/threonine-protein kinase
MSDVFISYKSEDRRRIQPLVHCLQSDGYSVWWDEQIGTGNVWREEIERELDAAACVVVVWSKHSVGREGAFVREEASRAQHRRVYLPVLIDSVSPPLGFGEMQATSLVGWKGNSSDHRYLAVRSGIQRLLPSGHAPETAPAAGRDRRAVLIGGGVAAAVLASAGAWEFLKASASAPSRSIAVLPFANLSGDPSEAYFSDGIAEELRNDLSRIGGLRVVARTSCEAVRNDAATVAARKLDVGTILTGSVRKSPDLIRVSAQLVDGSNGLERWAQTYDRPMGDLLTIQTDIAQRVAEALSIQLGTEVQLTLGGTRNPAAQDLLLKAKAEWDNPSGDGHRAISYLDGAIALDPNYAQAYAERAMYALDFTGNYATAAADWQRASVQAEEDARRAIAIAPRYPLGHTALSHFYSNTFQSAAALKEAMTACGLPGAGVDALQLYADQLLSFGRIHDRNVIFQRAFDLDPLSLSVIEDRIAGLYFEQRFADAVSSATTALNERPGDNYTRRFLGYAQIMLGQTNAATATFTKIDSADWHHFMGLALIAAHSDDRTTAMSLFSKFAEKAPDTFNFQSAQIEAQLGDRDAAFVSLDRCLQVRDPGVLWCKVDPFLAPLRGDARLTVLTTRLGLT